MIKNAREYQITRAQVARFERALHADVAQGVDASIAELELDALRSQLADLRYEIEEYDALEAGQRKVLEVEDLSELPRALIQARIAAKLSQRQLAERLGLKEQQVQRYEATDYCSASLSRMQEVVRALDVRLHQDVVLSTADVSARTLTTSLHNIGLDREFVRRRLVLDDEDGKTAWKTANVVRRIFKLPMSDVARGDFGELRRTGSPAMYKVPAGAAEPKLLAYSVYARYLAERTLACVVAPARASHLESQPRDVFRALRDTYGGVTFGAALRFVWDRGLTVLPLRDPGAFHGAFWRVKARGIIVLKQRTDSSERWLIDLLHEYCHAVQTQEAQDAEFVEPEESPLERRDSDEERFATAWASAAALDAREHELAQSCILEADGNIPSLKRVVPKVAARAGVPVGVLANYVAHRLGKSGDGDWWGVAATLQTTNEDPWRMTRDALFTHLEMHRLDRLDRDILTKALGESGVEHG